MAYKHKKWVRVDKQSIAKLDQSTVNSIRWNAALGNAKLSAKLGVDIKTIDYVLSNPAFMQHIEDLEEIDKRVDRA